MTRTRKLNLFSKETRERYAHAVYAEYEGNPPILRCDGKGYLWWNLDLTKKAKKAIADELKKFFCKQVICVPTAEHPEFRAVTKVYWDANWGLCYDYDRIVLCDGVSVTRHYQEPAAPEETVKVAWKVELVGEVNRHLQGIWKRYGADRGRTGK